jgi:hypothetical protein
MVFYCPRCGYKTDKKSNMKSHIKRKNICKPLLNDVIIDEDEIFVNNSSNICKFCNKEYSRSDSCKRHEIKCKIQNEVNKELTIEELKKQLKEEKNKNKQITNITNNTTNITNILIMNNYDDPDVSHIRTKHIYDALENFEKSKSEIVGLIYFNKDAPHNHSIYYPNPRNDKIMAYKDGSFNSMRIEDFNNFVGDGLDDKVQILVNEKLDEDKYQRVKTYNNTERDKEKDTKLILLKAHDKANLVKKRKKIIESDKTEVKTISD